MVAEKSQTKTIPKNLLEDKHTAHLQKENGAIFDKKPFKIHLEKGELLLCKEQLNNNSKLRKLGQK